MYIYQIENILNHKKYVGSTNNPDRRMKEHFSQGVKSAKYTKNHEALKLECVWECEDRGLATRLEYQIKQLDEYSIDLGIDIEQT